MSSLFKLDDDAFRGLLSWLDISSICSLDTAVGNVDERLMWLHSLHSIDSKAIDEYEHWHSSVRWLIMRGARATSIRARRSNLTSDRQITDMTFAGVGILCTQNVDSVNQGFLRWLGINCDTSIGLDRALSIRTQGLLRWLGMNCDTSNGFDMDSFTKTQGLSQVTSIDLYNCESISDVGVSAIAQGCPLLTRICLHGCRLISDMGVSAIAQGCPLLISIDLNNCQSISDVGLSAIAQGCPQLTSINLFIL